MWKRSAITRVSPGDQVVLVYQPQCGACPCCVSGDPHLCAPGLAANRAGMLLTGGPRLSVGGRAIHHHMGLSAFAEKAVVAEHSLVPVAIDIAPEIAALFGCAVMCGAGSVLNTSGLRAGDTIAIVGIGGVGASALLAARLAGAARIIAVDLDADKRKLALDLGATHAVTGGEDAAAEIKDLTGGGVDIGLESAGTLGAFKTALDATKRGGKAVTLGLVNPATPYALDIAAHVTGAKAIMGSYMGSCNPQIDIPKFIDFYKRGLFPIDRLITHRLALSDINTALDRMADSRALRQIVTP